ncbi:MAG: serine dehydratase, partial [Fervidobacterium nodosum]
MKYSELLEIWKETNLEFSEIILAQEMIETGRDPERVKENLRRLMNVILEESEKNIGKKFETLTGMTGDNGLKFYKNSPKMVSEFNHLATTVAISMGESN